MKGGIKVVVQLFLFLSWGHGSFFLLPLCKVTHSPLLAFSEMGSTWISNVTPTKIRRVSQFEGQIFIKGGRFIAQGAQLGAL